MAENALSDAAWNRRPGATAAIDALAALTRLDGDEELFTTLISIFQEDSLRLLEQLKANLARGNWREVERAAHSLKGLVANFNAHEAAQLAQGIENQARAHDAGGLEQRTRELSDQLERVRHALADWVATQ